MPLSARKFYFVLMLTTIVAIAPVLADQMAAELAQPQAGESALQPAVTPPPIPPPTQKPPGTNPGASSDSPPAPTPWNIVISAGSLRVAVFAEQYAEGGVGLDVYAIGDDGEGRLIFDISGDLLAALPEHPASNVRLAISADGKIALYLLTTGELQLNVGPDIAGTVKVAVFDAVPPSKIYFYEFNVYDILGH